MPYSIFMLPEGLITITGTNGGNGLDGLTKALAYILLRSHLRQVVL